MIYSFELIEFPIISQYYSVTRNTVWEINSTENILIIITKGRCMFSFDGEEFIANENDAVFIPANHSYKRQAIGLELCSMTYIHFLMKSETEQLDMKTMAHRLNLVKRKLDSNILSENEPPSYPHTIYIKNQNHIEDPEKTERYLKEINLFSVSREITCFFQSSIALCSILINLSQSTVAGFKNEYVLENNLEVPPNLKKAIGYIRKNYSQEITLEDLAKCCNVSKQQIIRYFNSAFNTTPIKYVIEYKILKAKELLLFQPHLSVKEIADELGFENQHYFARVFKKITGETASQYKYRVQHYTVPE